MARLEELALVVRSKNTSPFTYALDIIFGNEAYYLAFKSAELINVDLIARLYQIEPQQILDIIYFDPARAIKVCLPRDIPSGSPGDRDVYGAQQHAPLLQWEFSFDSSPDPPADTTA